MQLIKVGDFHFNGSLVEVTNLDELREALKCPVDRVMLDNMDNDTLRKAVDMKPVEPGPLPPSKHEFTMDRTALAIAAANEGCIDETLSALVAAAEAEFYMAEPGEFAASLIDKMSLPLPWRRDVIPSLHGERCTGSAPRTELPVKKF